MVELTKHAVFDALHKGCRRAAMLLSECDTQMESTLLSTFIGQASMHMRKIEAALKTCDPEIGSGDISFSELIMSDDLIRDLREQAKIETVTNLLSSDLHAFHSVLALNPDMSSDARIHTHPDYDEVRYLREVISAMRPGVIGIAGR